MNKNSKIYVAGHRGLVGSAIWNNLLQKGYCNLVGRTHAELDLLNGAAVKDFFDKEQPEYVVLAAAHVGGIMANNTYRADFIYENLQIQQNIIGESFRHGVKKLLFLGSTCIYPREAHQPISEDALLTSPLEYTNEPYAIAKIAGLKMCESFNLQYGTNYIAVMPTNLYGPRDNFDLEKSHVLPAMIRKIHLAHLLKNKDFESIRIDLDKLPISGVNGSSSIEEITNTLKNYGINDEYIQLWGTGTPLREFLWSEDMADASVYILENVSFDDLKGKEILGGRKGGVPEMALEYALKQKGLTLGTDVEKGEVNVRTDVQFNVLSGSFIAGEGDYVTLFEPTASELEKQGKGYIVASIGEESGIIPYTAYSAPKDYIEKNPDIIQSFTNAIYKGQTWVQNHSAEEIADSVAPFFTDFTKEELVTVVERYKSIDAWAHTPILSEESLNHLMEIMEEANELDKRAPYDKIVNTRFAEESVNTIK